MTEEEMKTKWCPHSRVIPVGHVEGEHTSTANVSAYNRGARLEPSRAVIIPVSATCLGSNCSQWRWKKVANPDWNSNQSVMYPAPNPFSQEPSGIDSDTHGYCGLAGQP